jgi:hypothetical protein
MAIVPVPVPASAVKRWFENLDKIISAAGELSAELVKAHIDEIRVKRADHEWLIPLSQVRPYLVARHLVARRPPRDGFG